MHRKTQVFQKAVAEAQRFVASGGAAGGILPPGMTGVFVPGEDEPVPTPAAKSAPKGGAARGGAGSKRGAAGAGLDSAHAGGGAGGVPRRIKIARWLGLLPPAADGMPPTLLRMQ